MAEPDLQSLLLENKTRVPAWRSTSVSRRSLIDHCRSDSHRVISIVAPAGYGKSTMLAEWAATDSRQIGWVSLDRTDDDPAALLPAIAAACSGFSPLVESVVADIMPVAGAEALGRSAPLLAAALAETLERFVLFIDDVHLVSSDACQDVLEVLLGRVPEGSQIVLAGRSESPLFARLRTTGVTSEVSEADLFLTTADARIVFEKAGAPTLGDDDLARIVDRCEGWPTGLFLCALIARAGEDATKITGRERYLADYLYRECVARLPQEAQTFLRRCSVMEQFSAEECNAVLQIEDAYARLHEIESANLFLTSMDRTRTWFRFHALFREYLVTELERAEGSPAVAELHRRAATWHEQHGVPAIAVEHLLHAKEPAKAAALIGDVALEIYGQGQVATVRRWLEELGDDVLFANPTLMVLITWIGLNLGDVRIGEKWAQALDRFDAADVPEERRESFESARAMVRAAMCRDGAAKVKVDAAYAFEHEPETSPWRDQAIHLWGSALLLSGETGAARQAFKDAIDVATIMQNPDTIILSEPELALIAIDAGQWTDASAHTQRGIEAIENSHLEGYPTTALALAVAARVALHQGDREQGRRLLAAGMRARVGCTVMLPYIAMRVRLQLAKAHVMLGDRTAAFHLLAECDDLRRKRPDVGILARQLDEFRTGLTAERNNGGAVPLTTAELRLLPYLQTHLTVVEIGERLFVSRNTVSSQVSSIYRKLAVTTRGAAVERATTLGLLGG